MQNIFLFHRVDLVRQATDRLWMNSDSTLTLTNRNCVWILVYNSHCFSSSFVISIHKSFKVRAFNGIKWWRTMAFRADWHDNVMTKIEICTIFEWCLDRFCDTLRNDSCTENDIWWWRARWDGGSVYRTIFANRFRCLLCLLHYAVWFTLKTTTINTRNKIHK